MGIESQLYVPPQHTLPEHLPRTSLVPWLTVRFPQPRSRVKAEFLLESVHRLRGLQGQKLQLLPSELRSLHSWHMLPPPAQPGTEPPMAHRLVIPTQDLRVGERQRNDSPLTQ